MRIAHFIKARDIFFLLSLLLTGCNSSSGDGGSSGLDPNIPPVTGGGWYQPTVMATWQWQLTGAINTGRAVDIYDIDLFEAPDQVITDLHNAGIKVICYFSAGSYEKGRPDAAQFDAADLGNVLDGWPDERWLDVRSSKVMDIMLARLDLAQSRGCDGVEPDNMDGYLPDNNSGFNFTANDQLAYNRLIANAAHNRNLAIALKNDLDQIPSLVDYFDFSVNEECFFYNECNTLSPFIDAGKPVLQAEYHSSYKNNIATRDTMCTNSINRQFSTLVLSVDLDDSYYYSCI